MATTPTSASRSTHDTGGLTPILGTNTEFNTTGYPAPPGSGRIVADAGGAVARQRISNATDSYPLLPSHPSIAFSIGDLQILGRVKDIGRLAFVVRFVTPGKGQLLQFAIQVTSPQGKELFRTSFPLGGIAGKPQSQYVFALDEEAAECAEEYFVPGNRIAVVATSATEVTKGEIYVAVKEYV
jgi:hypothetical protein